MTTIRMHYERNTDQYIAYEDQNEIARGKNLGEITEKLRVYFKIRDPEQANESSKPTAVAAVRQQLPAVKKS